MLSARLSVQRLLVCVMLSASDWLQNQQLPAPPLPRRQNQTLHRLWNAGAALRRAARVCSHSPHDQRGPRRRLAQEAPVYLGPGGPRSGLPDRLADAAALPQEVGERSARSQAVTCGGCCLRSSPGGNVRRRGLEASDGTNALKSTCLNVAYGGLDENNYYAFRV